MKDKPVVMLGGGKFGFHEDGSNVRDEDSGWSEESMSEGLVLVLVCSSSLFPDSSP